MTDLMLWEECTTKFVRKVQSDPARISSIVETANERWNFVRELKVTEKNVSFIFEQHYEIIKELLVALMLKKGLRSGNHQYLFTFFNREYSQYEAEVNTITQMSLLRNRLDYYGEKVDYAYFKENYKSFEEIIRLLFKLVK
ncbi:hypothetical protein HZC32_00505 [Candidatus Woesearchaeota archaeon]|nr:hypothetical protein [Candidatus Woesearchaeota archaeon]